MARAKKSLAAPPARGEAPSPAYLMSREWLCEVGSTPDNDIRAHQVALTYHHLALHLDDLLHAEGERRTNANWFNFGLWGTLTVTQAIGNDRPLPRLNTGRAMPFRRALTPTVLRVKASRGQEVARALAWAQLLIFVSTCNAFRLFAASDPSAGVPFSADDLVYSLDELDLPARVVDPIGVHRGRHAAAIAEAFRYYARARQAADPGVRAKFILGGNLLLTEIEQDIADRAVSVVLDLVPRGIGDALDWRLARLAQRFRGIPTHFSYLVLPFLHADERRAVDAVWSRFMTDQVLVMALPTETLRVGRDIPPLRRAAPYYPADLVFKSDLPDLGAGLTCAHGNNAPAECEECKPILRDLQDVASRVRSLDRTVGNGRGSAARDWRRWDERMNWALTLLRSRQHDDTLFWRPYTTRDEHRILEGDLPRRSGDPSALEIQPPAGWDNTAVNPFLRDRTDGL